MAAVRLLRPSSPSIPFTSSRRSVHPQIRWALHPRPGLSPSLHLTGTPPQIHQATSLLASKPSPSSSSRPEQSLPRPDLPLTSSESGAPPLLRPISDQQIRCPQSLPSPLLPAIPYTVFFQPRPDNEHVSSSPSASSLTAALLSLVKYNNGDNSSNGVVVIIVGPIAGLVDLEDLLAVERSIL